MDGHADGNYQHTLKPGAILSLKDVQTYEKIIPDGTYVF